MFGLPIFLKLKLFIQDVATDTTFCEEKKNIINNDMCIPSYQNTNYTYLHDLDWKKKEKQKCRTWFTKELENCVTWC